MLRSNLELRLKSMLLKNEPMVRGLAYNEFDESNLISYSGNVKKMKCSSKVISELFCIEINPLEPPGQ
jgi:hypothetical protein